MFRNAWQKKIEETRGLRAFVVLKFRNAGLSTTFWDIIIQRNLKKKKPEPTQNKSSSQFCFRHTVFFLSKW